MTPPDDRPLITLGRLTELDVDSITITDGGLELTGYGIALDADGRPLPDVARAGASMFPALAQNPDEPVTRLVFPAEPHLTGFYIPTSAQVPLGREDTDQGTYEWSTSLLAVPDRAFPMVESRLDGGFRDNDVSQAEASSYAWHAVPTAALEYTEGTGDLDHVLSLASETGDVALFVDDTNTGTRRRLVTWSCHPSDWYDGACTIERLWGSTWLPVIGRDLLDAGTDGWRITNGILRFSCSSGTFTLERWGGSDWESEEDIGFQGIEFDIVDVTSMAIMANAPHEVRVRITGRSTGSIWGSSSSGINTIDLRLRRGAELLELEWRSTIAGYKSEVASIGAHTDITGARYETSADADGNRYFEAFPDTEGNVTATELILGIGYVPSFGSSAADLRNRYFGPVYERVSIVGR